MARKPKQDLLDFSRNRPSWADRLIERDKNAESKVDAAIKSLLESGEVDSISEEQRQDMIRQVTETGDFEFTEPVTQEETTPVLPSTEPQEQDGVGGFLLRAGLYPGYTLTKEHADYANTVRRSADVQEELDQLTVEEHGVGLFGRLMSMPAGAPGVGGLAIKPIQQTKEQLAKQQADIAARKLELKKQRNILQVEAESLEERLGGRGEAGSRVSRALGGIAAQPEQALPLVGGIAGSAVGGVPGAVIGAGAGSLPMVDTAYNAAFSEAINEFGANKEEALAYAGVMTGIEFGTEALGGALGGAYSTGLKMFGLKKPGKELLKKALVSKVRSRIARGAGAALAEGGEEVAAELGGDVVREVMEAGDLLSSEDARSRLKKYNAERTVDRFDRMLDAGIAGAIMGGSIGSITGAYQYGAEIANQEQGTLDAADRRLELEKLAARKPDDELNQDIAREEERLRTEQAKEDAFRQAEEDRARQEQEAARQKEIEEEAGQRTIELERQFQGQTRVDRAPGITERVPVNPPAEITPEQVEQERAAQEQADVEAARQKEQAGLLDEIQKRQKVRKSTEGRGARLAREKAEKEEKARRRKVLDDLIRENPDADPAQLLPLYQQRIAEPTQPATQEAPATTPTTQTAPVARPAAPAVEGQVTTDTEIENMRKGLGLNMETTAQKPATPKESEAKRNRVISGIVRANKNKTADVQNLIRQGKIVVAANPEEIGRSDSGVGTYDSATGTMYLYTDRVDENNLVNSALQAALHEPVHAGQFNEREARSQVMQTLMSPESNSRVNQTIRTAARNGNTIAQAVVEDARKAAESNPDFMGDVESLELAPYLATRVEQARGKPLGQVGGAVRDVLSNARNFLRERTGLDLDITIGDLATATQQAAGEIVNTELTPEGEGTLQVEAGPQATGFRRAQQEGDTYQGIDERSERFEIDDSTAELNTKILPSIADRAVVPLPFALKHTELYEQYPFLEDYKIKTEEMPYGEDGYHDAEERTIVLSKYLTELADTDGSVRGRPAKELVRDIILHETQHAVQNFEGWEAGANAGNFMPKGTVNNRQRARDNLRTVIKNFDLGSAVAKLPPEWKRVWEHEASQAQSSNPEELAALFLDEGYYEDTTDRLAQRYGRTAYKNAVEQLTAANLEYETARTSAYRTYLRDRGEAAARNVELRSRMTPAERAATPFNETLATDPNSRRYNVTRDELIDTTPFVGGGRGFPRALNMAATNPVPAVKKSLSSTARTVISLFDSAQGVGREINAMIEAAESSPSEARMRAGNDLATYTHALSKEAANRGMSPDALNTQIQEEIDKATAKTESYNDTYAAFKSVVDKYGKAGKALLDMRNQIDALTKDIIQARLSKVDEGHPLSAKEKRLYETLFNNLGRYTHRQYAVNAGKVGDKFAKKVWDDYETVKTNKGKGTETQLENYNRVAKAVRYLVDKRLYIPEATELADLGTDQVHHLYDTWISSASDVPVEQMKQELEQYRELIGPERLENMAEAISKEILGLNTSDPKAIVNYFRGNKRDNTIVKERQNIPVEIRELMGEIKDPAMRMMLTVAKQAEFVARTKMFIEIANSGSPKVQPPDAGGLPQTKGLEQVKGEGWGPLDGYYLAPELKLRLQDVTATLGTFEQAVALSGVDTRLLSSVATNKFVEGWGKIAGLSKTMQVIYKPTRFLFNYLGSYRQLVSNGNIEPATWAKAHKAAIQLIAYSGPNAVAGPLAIEANKYGITDSAFVGELRSGQYRELESLVKKMAGMSPGQAMAAAQKANTVTTEFYAMMDVWSKIANFYNETNMLTDYYKAQGISKTTEEIKREAADRANRTNITYKRAAPLVKGAEKMGITNFMTYFYEVFRSDFGGALQVYDDLVRAAKTTDPKARNILAVHAAKRGIGLSAAWIGTAAIANALSDAAFGEGEDDEDKRYLLPEFLRYKDFVNVGEKENGNSVFLDWSQTDPAGPITDLMRVMLSEDTNLQDVADNFMELYVAPRVGSQILTAAYASFSEEGTAKGKPFIQQVAPSVYKEITDIMPGEDRVNKAWINVVESFLPGIVSGYKENNDIPVPKDLPSFLGNVLAYMGATMYDLDPARAATGAVIEYETSQRLAKRDFGNLLTDYPEGLSPSDLADKLGSATQREREKFYDLVNVTKGMRAIGMSEREISVMLKEVGLGADEIVKVRNQEFESKALTGKTIETKMKREMIGKTPKEKEEIKEKWDNIRLMIEGKN